MPISTIGQNGLNAPLSLTSPALGTPSSLVLTNATGLPQTGLATGVAGTGPAFSAYASSATSLTNSVATLLKYGTKDFDTGTCYNNTASTVTLNGISVPAYSFAPNVAGYYQVNACIYTSVTSTNAAILTYKNGSVWSINNGASGSINTYYQASSLIYCNGTSDYISMYLYFEGVGASTGTGSSYKFSSCLLRAS